MVYATALLLAAAMNGIALGEVFAAAAAVLVESTPFLILGISLGRLFKSRADWISYAGCGCGAGPSARSLPGAAVAWLAFGPLVAVARLTAAIAVGKLLHRLSARRHSSEEPQPSLLGALENLLPSALVAGVVSQLLARLDVAHSTAAAVVAGLVLGAAAPCGVGAIAVASALHARAPLAAIAYLCVAGIVDIRALGVRCGHRRRAHDALSYTALAASLAIVGLRHGDALVHPKLALALGLCAPVVAALSSLHRRERARFFAPAIVLLGALAGASPPTYRATETTLADLFPGERLSFTGRLADDAHHAALVRYAITCCRADAAPVSIRLATPIPIAADAWIRADGVVVECGDELCLLPHSVARIAPPSDPFLYR
jgi:hypothetical protein